ncbi:nuclear transport factor 2 family protein [Streptomyces sp. XM4193]|uniref:nuclear transport factor 2 family protein n=1 Tax=Streptomyces sp. XM4193 TaxID=2929782 RepID=UPI001FF84A46|nr:nuclear transport factor 2 family protein [Streptomyces sp. XM4193]MCK1796583.1 nuclear transport factor 2 family protein [Streptomyces sp. XM4193]
MSDRTPTPEPHAALDAAREFIHAVESKDLETADRLLAPEARQLFMQTHRAKTAEGVEDIIAGRVKGFCVADIKGKKDVLGYTKALFDKFTPLRWRDQRWTAAEGGREAHFYGKGDMTVARTGKPYRNIYVIRFDIENGKIVRIAEYGNAFMYVGLLIPPNGPERRGALRAVGRMISPTMSARSGR